MTRAGGRYQSAQLQHPGRGFPGEDVEHGVGPAWFAQPGGIAAEALPIRPSISTREAKQIILLYMKNLLKKVLKKKRPITILTSAKS